MDIQTLKDKIIQLAIQGKLVQQDKNDEPVNIFIEKIKKEKEQLIKDKKIKRNKKLLGITESDIPYELPQNWRWVRLGDISDLKIGKTPKREVKEYWENGSVPWVSISDMDQKGFVTSTKEKVSMLASEKEFKNNISPKGTLIMSFKLSIGKVGILDMDSYHNEAIVSIFPILDKDETLKMYLFSILGGIDLLSDTKKAIKGKTLNKDTLTNLLIPLPPLNEQKRIAEKIDFLFNLIEELESNKQNLLQNISEVKYKVLQVAIQGGLVSQDKNDEPASVLLKEIKKEKEQLIKDKKIKKEKPLLEIKKEDIPYELPIGWEWVKLGEICKSIGGNGFPLKYQGLTSGKLPFFKVKDLSNEIISNYVTKSKNWIIDDDIANKFTLIKKYSIVFPKIGGALLTNNRKIMGLDGFIDNNCMALTCYHTSMYKYVFLFMNTIDFGKLCKGTSIPSISKDIVDNLLIPLPPLNEQKRIVEKVDYIFELCDKLEEEIFK